MGRGGEGTDVGLVGWGGGGGGGGGVAAVGTVREEGTVWEEKVAVEGGLWEGGKGYASVAGV